MGGTKGSNLVGHIVSASCGLFAFCVYYKTAYRTLAPGDSPELANNVYGPSVSHPPGYPLLMLIGHYFLKIRPLIDLIGGDVFSLNLLGGLFTSAGCMFLCESAYLISEGRGEDNTVDGKEDVRRLPRGFGSIGGAVLAGGLFAFNRNTWEYSTHFEVFSLNSLLVSLLILMAVRFLRDPSKWSNVIGGCLISGVCMANQHTSVLFILPMTIFVPIVLYRSGNLSLDLSLYSIVAGILGLIIPYGWLFAIAKTSPTSWGDISTLNGITRLFLRSDYGSLKLSPGHEHLAAPLALLDIYFKDVWSETLVVGSFLAVAGVLGLLHISWTCLCCKRKPRGKGKDESCRNFSFDRSVAGLLLICFFFYWGFFAPLANMKMHSVYLGVLKRFMIQPSIVVCVSAGVGASAVESWLCHVVSPKKGPVTAPGSSKEEVLVAESASLRRRKAPGSPSREKEVGKGATSAASSSPPRWSCGAWVVRVVVLSICSLLVLKLVERNYIYVDGSIRWQHERLSKDLLESLPENAMIVTFGDNYHPILFMQHALGIRPDVRLMPLIYASHTWYSMYDSRVKLPQGKTPLYGGFDNRFNFKDLIDANLQDKKTGGVFVLRTVDSVLPPFDDRAVNSYGDRLVPYGLFTQLQPHVRFPRFPLTNLKNLKEYLRLVNQFNSHHPEPILINPNIREDLWEARTSDEYSAGLEAMGHRLLNEALSLAGPASVKNLALCAAGALLAETLLHRVAPPTHTYKENPHVMCTNSHNFASSLYSFGQSDDPSDLPSGCEILPDLWKDILAVRDHNGTITGRRDWMLEVLRPRLLWPRALHIWLQTKAHCGAEKIPESGYVVMDFLIPRVTPEPLDAAGSLSANTSSYFVTPYVPEKTSPHSEKP